MIGLILILFVALIGMRVKKRKEYQESLKKIVPPAAAVTVQKPRIGRIAETLTANGTVMAHEEVAVTPKASGRLVRLLVEEGSPVNRGQILGEIGHDELEAQIAQAQAQVGTAQANLDLLINGPLQSEITRASATVKQAEANLAQLKASLMHAENERQRYENLAQEDVISRQQLDTARTQVSVLQQQVQAAQAQIVSAQASLKLLTLGTRPEHIRSARSQLEQAHAAVRLLKTQRPNYWLVSPLHGVVTHRHLDPGSLVAPGNPVVTVSKTDPLNIELFLPEKLLSLLHPGQPMNCTSPAFAGKKIWSHLKEVSPEVDKQARLIKVKSLITQKMALKAGMLLNCSLILKEKQQVLLLPPEALVGSEEQPTVYLAVHNRVIHRPVSVGLRNAHEVEILRGLASHESVIVEGNVFIKPGDKIQVQEAVSLAPEVPRTLSMLIPF